MSAFQKLTGWLKSEEDLQVAVDRLEARKIAHEAEKPTGIDPAKHRAWLAQSREIDDDLASHRESLRIASEQRALAKLKADEAKRDSEEREISKLADEHAKLTIDLEADFRRIAPKVARLKEYEDLIAEWNAGRGSRSFILDGERRVREVPAREVPAITRKEKAWVDANGGRPSQLIMRNGELVPTGMSGDYTYRTVEVVESPARFVPARMPPRFTEAAVLPALDGSTHWPKS